MTFFNKDQMARISVADYQTPHAIRFSPIYDVPEPWRDFGLLKYGWVKKGDLGVLKLRHVQLQGRYSLDLDLRWMTWAFTVRDVVDGEEKLRTAFMDARIIKAEWGQYGDPISWALTLQTSRRQAL